MDLIIWLDWEERAAQRREAEQDNELLKEWLGTGTRCSSPRPDPSNSVEHCCCEPTSLTAALGSYRRTSLRIAKLRLPTRVPTSYELFEGCLSFCSSRTGSGQFIDPLLQEVGFFQISGEGLVELSGWDLDSGQVVSQPVLHEVDAHF